MRSLQAIRRHIHARPELARYEHTTSALVQRNSFSLNLVPVPLSAGNGLYCDVVGVRPGPTTAIRAEMDALPVQDEQAGVLSFIV